MDEYRLQKCKEFSVPYSVVPVDIAGYRASIHELALIEAFLIDEGYMDTAKRLDGLVKIMEKLLSNYYYQKYGDDMEVD